MVKGVDIVAGRGWPLVEPVPWCRRALMVDLVQGKYDRYLDEQHRHRMDREYRAGVHQDVLYKQRDEERWRSEIPAQKRERRQQQCVPSSLSASACLIGGDR